jgi:hypothetical protein
MKTLNNLKKVAIKAIAVLMCLSLSVTAHAKVKIYPALSDLQGCQYSYTLKAKDSGTSTWNTVPLYNVQVTNQKGGGVNTTFGNFDCSGSTDIQITFDAAVTSARVRPESLNITPAVSGNTITFTIPGPKKFYVDINGDHYAKCIHVCASPMEVNPPHPDDPNVVYVAAGTNNTKNITLKSGQTLYVQGGAAVAGVTLDNTSNCKVLGRGFIYRPDRDAFSLINASNVTINGLIDINHGWGDNGGDCLRCGNSSNVSISNLVSFSSKKWGDGINIFCSNDVAVDDVFIRTNDDAITFYGGGKSGFSGNSKNITVTNSVLLNDLAQAFHFGVYGDKNTDTEIRDITVSNIDIDDWGRTPGRPLIYFTMGDKVKAANIKFKNIRSTGYMDSSFNKSFIGMAVVYNSTYNYNPGREIDGVYFTDCTYSSPLGVPPSSIKAYDENRTVKNVKFTNLKINGTTITSALQGNFKVGNHTSNIVFSPSEN